MTLAVEWPEPGEILAYWDRSVEALGYLEEAGRTRRLVPSSQFIGMTLAEFDAELRAMRGELDQQVSMALLASCEALLRVDFADRVSRIKKEPRSVRSKFKALSDEHRDRVGLEDILDVWKNHVGRPDRFAAFQEYLRVRNWLAHGRYWTLRTARKAEPQDVLHVIRELLSVLPGFPMP